MTIIGCFFSFFFYTQPAFVHLLGDFLSVSYVERLFFHGPFLEPFFVFLIKFNWQSFRHFYKKALEEKNWFIRIYKNVVI